MKMLPIQTNFAAGELSPRFFARSDISGYQAGLASVSNFVPTMHGPIIRRPGSKYMATLDGTYAKCFGFPVDADNGFVVVITNAPKIYAIDLSDFSNISEFTSPWTWTNQIQRIQICITPAGNRMYFWVDNEAPQQLTYNRSTGNFNFAAMSFSTSPPEWGAGNYPKCATFFQGRLIAGGTPNEPNNFWGSRSGVYLDMYTASPSAADDPYSFALSKHGTINWMAGIKNLLIGMDTGEFIVTSEGGVVTPTDIQVEQQSANGSALIQPVEIGNNIVYASPDKRKIREIGFRWTEDAWVSRDITFTSEHITKNNLINQIIFAQNPENLLIMVTDQGKALFCVYEWQNNIVGWANAESTGVIQSIATTQLNGTNISTWVTLREVDHGAGTVEELHIEMLDADLHMDDAGEETSISSIADAQHLAGQEVCVLIDGAVHPNVTIATDGTASLDWSGTTVQYGLPYLSELQTMPIDKGHPQGSAMPTRKSWNKIYCRLFDSAIPYISGEYPPDRSPTTPLNTAEPLMTGDIFVSNLGSDQYAQVTVLMNLPLPCNLGGLFGELELDTLA